MKQFTRDSPTTHHTANSYNQSLLLLPNQPLTESTKRL
ncbi:unnamed protein product (macronuclear) [Paramecium tetraurelia]|uniref:Uncharacterized protein n=1 Tax=Paramecium tetraurelia TaxID=5888 RepID=A0CH19_PARTE|nr:uncharacterized protein GSPATT00007526001 [Paramecium tetraurelia]CAK70086.1 unnamed protein product [Paramecium tetraurelia]|eukprot:XP_001437483.1 hypothetical protein (macronuclear) [Paramecium tetraurelia strain d4-2]